jgi:hypothetical protein
MAVYHQKPRVLSFKEMFSFWVDNLLKEKPHLIVKHMNTNGKVPQVLYTVRAEIEYLNKLNLELDSKVEQLEIEDREFPYKFTAATKEIFNLKKEIAQNKSKLKDLEKLPQDLKEVLIDYNQFKAILNTYNRKASLEIINGATLNLSNKLGYIQIRKIEPSIKSVSRIDWKASLDYKQELAASGKTPKSKEAPEGLNWLVYRNQSFYLRWAWIKRYGGGCTVKNNRVYAFCPTASSSGAGKEKVLGNKGLLVKAQLENPLLHTKYTVVKLAGKDSTVILNS